jgi:uncharacterized protein (TIGR02246 family)
MSSRVSFDSPAAVSEGFVAAINRGDLPGALALYREDAVLLAPDGHCARGIQAISELLSGLVSMETQMATQVEHVVQTSDIAVATETWTMRMRGPDGATSEQSGESIVLFTGTPDGWRFLIDAPWGL